MNDALVEAQQLREANQAAAQREAQVIVREAEAEARRILDETRGAKADLERQAAEVQRQYQQYVGGFRALLQRHPLRQQALEARPGGGCARRGWPPARGASPTPPSRPS